MMKIGTKNEIYGTLKSMMFMGGERYYFFEKDGVVSMIPASALGEGK
jgi:hypothetical protein